MKQGAEPAPRISIAMATYNGAGYLPAQLASLAVQSALPSELVVTDDGSTDATAQIIEDFARFAAFPVKLFRNQTRLMFRDNFLRAAELCTGELIAFCDQDDVWHPDKLLRCAKEFAAPAVADCHISDRGGTTKNAASIRSSLIRVLPSCSVVTCLTSPTISRGQITFCHPEGSTRRWPMTNGYFSWPAFLARS
jgi:glycosyltransferase involved in cell wall biosynthesis